MTNWKQFLYDCFVPWTKSSEDLATLNTTLNNLHKDIRFTLQYNNKELSFLDVLVKSNEGKIGTDIFYKKTDNKQYLLFNSSHPRHIKINIPFNLARRLRTIISEEQLYRFACRN